MREKETTSEIQETHLEMWVRSVEPLPVKKADAGFVPFVLKDVDQDNQLRMEINKILTGRACSTLQLAQHLR
jgi:hypothetical protein